MTAETITARPTADLAKLLAQPKAKQQQRRQRGINHLDHTTCINAMAEAGAKHTIIKKGQLVRRLQDGGGLYLEIIVRGDRVSRHWYCRYYNLQGEKRRLALGAFPAETSLLEAREQRKLIKQQLAANPPIDPALARKLGKLQVVAAGEADARFRAIADVWFAKFYPATRPQNTLDNMGRIKRYLCDGYAGAPGLGDLPMDSITLDHVLTLLAAAQGHSPITREHMQSMLRRIFSHATVFKQMKVNPLAGIVFDDVFPNAEAGESFAAATNVDDIGAVLRKLAELGGTPSPYLNGRPNKYTALGAALDDRVARAYFALLALTFVRPSELRLAQWREFDIDGKQPMWTVPKGRLKQRGYRKRKGKEHKDHRVPLARQAVAVLRRLRAITGHSTFVFPSPHKASAAVSRSTISNKLRAAGVGENEHTSHGFRAAARTMLQDDAYAADGKTKLFAPHVIECALNHIPNRYYDGDQFAERAPLMQWYADHLDLARGGEQRLAA